MQSSFLKSSKSSSSLSSRSLSREPSMTTARRRALPEMLLLPPLMVMVVVVLALPAVTTMYNQEQIPEFLNTPSHVTVKEGSVAILPCWVRHLGDREVAWRSLDTDTFLTIGKATMLQDSNLVLEHLRKGEGVTSWDLIFKGARLEQAGDYECQISSQETLVRIVTLTVIDEPTYNSQLILTTGKTMNLECRVSADNVSSDFDLLWYKNGRLIDNVNFPHVVVTRYTMQATKTHVKGLVIENVSLDDSGIYTCRAPSKLTLNTTKVTVIRADPSNSKREEARDLSVPKPTEAKLEEHNVEDFLNSQYSKGTYKHRTKTSESSSASLSRHRDQTCVALLAALLTSCLFLRHPLPPTPGLWHRTS